MDLLEKLERKNAMRDEFRRRDSLLSKHGRSSERCLITSTYHVPCGMPPAVTEDDEHNLVYYHAGFCSEKHECMFNDYLSSGDDYVRKKDLERQLEKLVKGFSAKVSKLVEKYGRDEVSNILGEIKF